MQPVSVQEESAQRHVHHSYMWLGSLRTAGIILFATAISMGSSLVGVIAEGEVGTPEDARVVMIIFGLCALVMLLIVAAVVVYQVVSYKHLYYELTPTEFNLYKGIFSKKRVHIPYQRVQSVDQRASLLQRFAGVCTVNIDTAGGSSNKAVIVPYLTKQDAENLRVELFARKMYGEKAAGGEGSFEEFVASRIAGQANAQSNVLDAPANVWNEFAGVFAGESVEMAKPSFEYGLSNKELVFTGLSNSTSLILIVFGIVGVAMQVMTPLFEVMPGAGEGLIDALVMTAAGDLAMGAAVAVALSVIGSLVLVWLVSVLATCVSYGGFRACRRGSRIEVERGLLQHQFQGIDIDRVQSVTIKQTLIRRLMGYCELSVGKIEAAAEGDNSQNNSGLQEGVVIHPFVKVERVGEIINGIIPEFADAPNDAKPVASVALRRAIIRRGIIQGFGFWLAVILALTQASLHFAAGYIEAELVPALPYIDMIAVAGYVLAAVLFALDVVSAVVWARESSFAVNDRFMQVNNGGLSRKSVCIPRTKIQFGYARSNPLQRNAKTATINAQTAAGVGGTTERLIDVREEDAQAWLDWLKPRTR